MYLNFKEKLSALPETHLSLITYNKFEPVIQVNLNQSIIPEGERNQTLLSLGGTLRRRGFTEGAIRAALMEENSKRCIPPLALDEVESIIKSLMKYDDNSPQMKKVEDFISEFKKLLLLFNCRNQPFAVYEKDKTRQIIPMHSEKFKFLLSSVYYDRYGQPIKKNTLQEMLDTFIAEALFKSENIPLSNRFFKNDNMIRVDLSNNEGSDVEITPDGWKVDKDAPICFERMSHQLPQVLPHHGGEIKDLLKFINIKNSGDQLITLVWLIVAMIPEISHPIILPYGAQGSGKSTFCRILRTLLDPSHTTYLEIPYKEDELVQILSQHAVPVFDNQGYLKPHLVNLLCRAVTGGGFSKRKLYSDMESVFFSYKRPIVLNGINLPSSAPDFLDRCVLIELTRISGENRKTEEEILKEFETYRPGILGAMYDILSEAMRAYPSIKLPQLPRMADFARWGAAVAVAMGEKVEDFIQALEKNSARQTEEALEDDPVAQAIIHFMDDKENWEGIARTLYEKLDSQFHSENFRYKTWPKSPELLAKRLRKLQSSLEEIGIKILFSSGHAKGRLIKIIKKNEF